MRTGPLTLAALLLTTGLAGCVGRDPMDAAIRRLGGDPAKQRRARMELLLSSRDPVPALKRAVLDTGQRRPVRMGAVEVLGAIGRRQKDERAFEFLNELVEGDDPETRDAAVEAFIDTEYVEAIPALARLRASADAELVKQIDRALKSSVARKVRDIESLWSSPEAAMTAYGEARAMGLTRGQVAYSEARFLEIRGREEQASRMYRELGVVRRWWLIGTFPNRQGRGFRTVYPPESEIDLSAEYASGGEQAGWYLIERDLPGGFLDFDDYFVQTDNVVAYTLVFALSDREQPAEVRAGSDDTLTVFVNGETVWANDVYRAAEFDDDIAECTLREGVNTLLFKVCDDWGQWALIARVTGPGDTPLEGVTLTVEPPPGFVHTAAGSQPR